MRAFRPLSVFLLGLLPLAAIAATELPGFDRNTIQFEDARLSYLERKGVGAIPLVLLPGTFSDAHSWADLVPHLDAALPVLLIEMRGQGESRPPLQDGGIETLATDVVRLLDRIGIERFFVGGHSLGGMVSIEVGNQRPDRVAGILSIEGWTNHRAARDAFAGDMMSTLTPDLVEKRAASRERVISRLTSEEREYFGRIWRKWDGFEFLSTTALPVLEVYGDRGKEPATRKELHLPDRANIELVWIEGATHSLPLERPAELGKILMSFVRQIVEKEKAGSSPVDSSNR